MAAHDDGGGQSGDDDVQAGTGSILECISDAVSCYSFFVGSTSTAFAA